MSLKRNPTSFISHPQQRQICHYFLLNWTRSDFLWFLVLGTPFDDYFPNWWGLLCLLFFLLPESLCFGWYFVKSLFRPFLSFWRFLSNLSPGSFSLSWNFFLFFILILIILISLPSSASIFINFAFAVLGFSWRVLILRLIRQTWRINFKLSLLVVTFIWWKWPFCLKSSPWRLFVVFWAPMIIPFSLLSVLVLLVDWGSISLTARALEHSRLLKSLIQLQIAFVEATWRELPRPSIKPIWWWYETSLPLPRFSIFFGRFICLKIRISKIKTENENNCAFKVHN